MCLFNLFTEVMGCGDCRICSPVGSSLGKRVVLKIGSTAHIHTCVYTQCIISGGVFTVSCFFQAEGFTVTLLLIYKIVINDISKETKNFIFEGLFYM